MTYTNRRNSICREIEAQGQNAQKIERIKAHCVVLPPSSMSLGPHDGCGIAHMIEVGIYKHFKPTPSQQVAFLWHRHGVWKT